MYYEISTFRHGPILHAYWSLSIRVYLAFNVKGMECFFCDRTGCCSSIASNPSLPIHDVSIKVPDHSLKLLGGARRSTSEEVCKRLNQIDHTRAHI